MLQLDLSLQRELEPLLELETIEGRIDLHNDYELHHIYINGDVLEIYMMKSAVSETYSPRSKWERVALIFSSFKMENVALSMLLNEKTGFSIDNLSRSITTATHLYSYILSFTEGNEYEIECKSAFLALD